MFRRLGHASHKQGLTENKDTSRRDADRTPQKFVKIIEDIVFTSVWDPVKCWRSVKCGWISAVRLARRLQAVTHSVRITSLISFLVLRVTVFLTPKSALNNLS